MSLPSSPARTTESASMSTALSLTRPQKAAAMLVAMGKPSASRLLKFFKQEELRALIDAAQDAAHHPAERAGEDRRRVRGRVHRGRRPARFRRQDGDDAQRVAVSRRDERADGRREGGRGHRRAAADLADGRKARAGAARRVPRRRTSADGGGGAVEAGAAGRRQCAADARQIGARRDHQAHADDVQDTRDGGQDRRGPDQGAGAGRERDARTFRPARTVSQTCSTNSTSRSSRRSCRISKRPAPATSTAIRARLFAFEDILLLTQKARVTLFDGITSELVTLALRNADPAHGGSRCCRRSARGRAA